MNGKWDHAELGYQKSLCSPCLTKCFHEGATPNRMQLSEFKLLLLLVGKLHDMQSLQKEEKAQ